MSTRTVSVITFLLSLGISSMIPIMNAHAQMPVVSHTTVRVNTPAMYPLWEGVDVAINNVINNGDALIMSNVLKELDDMQRRHEVELPYSYSLSGTISIKGNKMKSKSTRRLTPQDEKKKKEFEAKVARRLAIVLSENPQLACAVPSGQEATPDLSLEPQPDQYKDKKGFVEAYASYKVKNADEDIRARYAKKLGGMNEYRREMKREAELIWKQASKR